MWCVISPDCIGHNAKQKGYLPYTVLGKFSTEEEARDCAAFHYFFVGSCEVRYDGR